MSDQNYQLIAMAPEAVEWLVAAMRTATSRVEDAPWETESNAFEVHGRPVTVIRRGRPPASA